MIFFFIGYIIFLLAYTVFSFIILYHLLRYGFKDSASSIMLFLYPVISIVIIVATFIFFFSVGGLSANNFFQGL